MSTEHDCPEVGSGLTVPVEHDLWWGYLCPALANIGALKKAQQELMSLGTDWAEAGRILSRVQSFYVDAAHGAARRYVADRDAEHADRLAAVEAERDTAERERDDWRYSAQGLAARAESAEAERDAALREVAERDARLAKVMDTVAIVKRDHTMPPNKDRKGYDYRMGWWDAVNFSTDFIQRQHRAALANPDGGDR